MPLSTPKTKIMTLQYIQDKEGKTTGVIIPIEEWESLKEKYSELQEADSPSDLASWQKNIIDERIADYYDDPKNVNDFDKTLNEIEKSL